VGQVRLVRLVDVEVSKQQQTTVVERPPQEAAGLVAELGGRLQPLDFRAEHRIELADS